MTYRAQITILVIWIIFDFLFEIMHKWTGGKQSKTCEILLEGSIKSDEYFQSTLSFLPIDLLCAYLPICDRAGAL